MGSFKFFFFRKTVPTKSGLSQADETILNLKYAIRRAVGSRVQWYGLDTSATMVDYVPLIVGGGSDTKRLERQN